MTRDADNDNPTIAAGPSLDQTPSWQNLSHGNTALAEQPTPEVASHPQQDHSDEALNEARPQPTDELSAGGQPLVSETGSSAQPQPAAEIIPSSNALPISALGISVPHRPVPAAQSVAIEPRVPRAQTQARSRPTDLGKQDSAHLFNRPPGAVNSQAEPSPMEQAINTKPRKPVTAQPGFLAGLVAALAFGGAFYGYLVL